MSELFFIIFLFTLIYIIMESLQKVICKNNNEKLIKILIIKIKLVYQKIVENNNNYL